jgi:uracil-DNA glycosylase
MKINTTELQKIHDELIDLKKSPLYTYRTENKYIPVIGEGNQTARIMFVGEAPGETEAKTGKPFCGRSGKLLDELLASIRMNRSTVFVTNLVKDRPQDNRDPSTEEIALYGPLLKRQIEAIQPRVIACLGRLSMKYLFETYGIGDQLKPISDIHGKEFKATTSYGTVTIVALYHPAYALYNGSMKPVLKKDFKILKKYI